MKKIYFSFNLPLKTLKTFCFLLVIFFSILSYGQDVKNHLGTSLPGSGTLEIPAGVGMSGNTIKVQTWGAGGGGGGCASLLGIVTLLNVGGGGGGGAFNEGVLNNVGENPDNIKLAYTIGAGGAGGTAAIVDGRNGGNSFFSTVGANGGQGGTAAVLLGSTTSNGVGGQGGQGGSFSGGNGFNAGNVLLGVGLQSGAGGGGAGSGGEGQGSSLLNTLSQIGGNGGIANNNDGGAGGKGGDGFSSVVLFSRDGQPGSFPAGGGGGSVTLADALGLLGRGQGGNGANGQIKVTYTCPVYTVSNITADNVCVTSGTTVVTLNGFLPIGKYTVTYDVSSPSQTGLQAVDVRVTTTGTLKFTVTGLTTVGTSRISIKNIKSVDCSTPINSYVDVTVSPNLTAAVSIATASSGAICYGTSVTFTATPTNGGTAPIYQWRVNGVNVAGANGATYSNSTLVNGDVVSCVMTSNATPCLTGNPATSNPITMTVSGPVANPVTVCIGGSGSLTASGCVENSISITKDPGSLDLTGSGLNWYASNQSVASDVNGGLGGGSFSTKNLIARGFNINNIPANAIITGIQVSVRKYSSHNESNRYVRDKTVSLIDGVDNKAAISTNWSTTSTTTNYGGSADLWGRTWTPADINNNVNFGVIIAANISTTTLFQVIAYIDTINITVTYYIPNTVNWYTVPSGGTPVASGISFNPVGVTNSGLANTNTAGTHTYYAACSAAPECRTPVKFIINGTPAIAAISSPAALCAGGTLNPVVPVVTNNSSVITASGWQIETGVNSNSYTDLAVPYTVAVADNGKHIRYYVSNSCTTVYSNAEAITVNSVLAPVIGTPTDPVCSAPTASVNVNGLSGNWTINATPNVGLTGLTGSGTTATIAGLAPETTYNFTFSNGSCTSANFSVVVKKLPVKTWKNGAWDGAIPTIEEKVIFESDYSINESVTACSCEVKSGAVVVFNSGNYLKLRNELIVDTDGLLTFENNASLVQINNVLNSGIINYKRTTTPVNRYDFTYWSTPVLGMTLKLLSPGTFYDKYFKYDNAWVSIVRETAMDIGEGYSVRAPQIIAISGNPVHYPAVFKGVPFNGEVRKDLVGSRVYLLGNPYPSAISADAFLIANETKLLGTLYFWTHNSPPSEHINGDKKYNYTTNDYATYNLTGGTATRAAIPDSDLNYPDINANVPNGNIAAAQGFFAPASAAGGEIVFNNSMRLLSNIVMDNSQFFKLSDASKSNAVDITAIEKNRVWLNLVNEEGAFKQTLVGYITGATNDYEGSFDGISYDGNEYLDFYSVGQDLNLAIQGRALPFQQKDSVALGYKSAIKGDFKISIDHSDGILFNQQIFVEDKDLQILHDLKKAPYSFTTEKGIFNNRFVLRYEDPNAVIEVVDMSVEGVMISTKNKIITIATEDATIIETVAVYDFSGKLLYADNEVNLESTTISNLSTAHQALMVQVVLENGKKAVKKIIY